MEELSVTLKQISTHFDILVLSETFNISEPDIYKIKGYNILHKDGNINRNDGVVALIREEIKYEYKIVYFWDIKGIEIKIIEKNQGLLLTCLYRLPSACVNTSIRNYLERVRDNDLHIITGDLNIYILSEENYVNDNKTS